jgi:OCT family organic cation transporter-like MFS transporter 4/5
LNVRLLDESIRFLYSQGRIAEAVKIAKNAVRLNGGSFTNNYKISENNSTFKRQHSFVLSGLADILRFPIMRCRAIITAFNWFAISLCFYGLAFNTGRLSGNPYLVFFISAAADLPGFFFVVLLVNKTGRRSLNATFLFIGGGLCIITTLIPRGIFFYKAQKLNNYVVENQ